LTATNQQSETTPQRPEEKPTDETIKETFESIIIAFILAFVFRAFIVEAFVIPTGSMAPTLLGAHHRVQCQQCGYRFKSEVPDLDLGSQRLVPLTSQRPVPIICPMCHFNTMLPLGTHPDSGDRILVHKYIYSVSEPRRWDVVVFKNPTQPKQNYIKRLVGLPGESLCIVEGNVFVKETQEDDSGWAIARKTDRPRVQRDLWQPIYHSVYLPLDDGDTRSGSGRVLPWRVPWGVAKGNWEIDDRRSYAFDGQGAGRIDFSLERALIGGRGIFAYNQTKFRDGGRGYPSFNNQDLYRSSVLSERDILSLIQIDALEDLRIASDVVPQADGAALEISTEARLDDPEGKLHRLIARIAPDGQATLVRVDGGSGIETPLDQATIEPLQAGQTRKVELWYVDQQASLWVDGRRVLVRDFELPWSDVRDRTPIRRLPEPSITVRGAPAALHRVEVDRDLFYFSSRVGSDRAVNRGGMAKSIDRLDINQGQQPRVRIEEQRVNLEPDHFFCIGDNSPYSLDGRLWTTINPWIDQRLFPDSAQSIGRVPRELMIGRAFFVYYPAPFRLSPTVPAVFPNFADMRFIH